MEKADKRLRRDDAIELALLRAIFAADSDFTSDTCNRIKLILSDSSELTGPATYTRRAFSPPHQTGRRSNCGARFPPRPPRRRRHHHHRRRRCRNHCLSSRPCPSAGRRRCRGTYRPRWPHESSWLCRDPAPGCKRRHTCF